MKKDGKLNRNVSTSRAAKSLTGTSLALLAASMLGCAATNESGAASAGGAPAAGTTDLIHCYGVNICKGHNDCKTASNACGGQAACNGSGFVAMPSKSCKDVGGKQQDDWSGTISKADLIHCHGVNICKGHNDCKTATNACAGHATCKGSGWVATSEKACKDIGGKI